MRNIKIFCEYDGTEYSGWQRQENGRTIQGEIENALRRILQEDVGLIGAGRTDAGVHARGQVANFRSSNRLPLDELRHGLNALLPADIVIRSAEDVPSEFHARFSARERSYTYTISRMPTAIMRNYVWHVSYELDVDSLRWAAAATLGDHDFTSFCKSASEVDNFRCVIRAARWDVEGPLLRFTVRADRFLHGMVRALVGTMVDVGRKHTSLEDFVALLEKKDRRLAGPAAPPQGLVLESVSYPETGV